MQVYYSSFKQTHDLTIQIHRVPRLTCRERILSTKSLMPARSTTVSASCTTRKADPHLSFRFSVPVLNRQPSRSIEILQIKLLYAASYRVKSP